MKRIEFEPAFLRKLEQLSVAARRAFAGKMKGERRSPRRGSSVEFADYRGYSQGDDYRHIDWNVFARFENLVLKLFIEEEDLRVTILLDRSRSMDFGVPNKFDFACRTAAALGYVGLSNLDRVSVAAFSDAGLELSPVFHNRNRIHALLEFLQDLECSGRTSFPDAVEEFLSRPGRKGVVMILSDFLHEDGYERPLNRLIFAGHAPALVQILSPEELHPPAGGDWTFLDSETGGRVDLSLGNRAVRLYRSRLKSYTDALDAFCRTRNIPVARATTDTDFESMLLALFRKAALLR